MTYVGRVAQKNRTEIIIIIIIINSHFFCSHHKKACALQPLTVMKTKIVKINTTANKNNKESIK